MALLSKKIMESIKKIEINRILIHSFLYGATAKVDDILYINYETDWNKLMRVIEKIEELNYRVTLCFENCYIERYSEDGEHPLEDGSDDIIEAYGDTKTESAYSAIISFINWYNKQQ